MLEKSNLKEETKVKWREVMTLSFMSSEESNDDEGGSVLLVKSLPWRAPKVNKI